MACIYLSFQLQHDTSTNIIVNQGLGRCFNDLLAQVDISAKYSTNTLTTLLAFNPLLPIVDFWLHSHQPPIVAFSNILD